MTLLLFSEIHENLTPPAFGGDFAAHIARKAHSKGRAASLTAWNLLALGLRRLGYADLPAVAFGSRGKPEFSNMDLHFSLAHSNNLAAALLSDAPCGVDVERVRPDVAERLRERCLSPRERARQLDFFECWTKKECIGKLNGRGIGSHPARTDTLDAQWADQFYTQRITDTAGSEYVLTALCADAPILIQEKL